MDPFPATVGVRQEHYREHMNRKAQERILGRKLSIAEFRENPDLYIPYEGRRGTLERIKSCQTRLFQLDLNNDV
jgi:hypothetical protein